MEIKAINKANIRRKLAKQALDHLRNCKNYDEFSYHWQAFLTHWKGVYTALEQGAKASPQSRQWFGSKKTFRKNDELLQYLFQARNDAEHGLDEVTKNISGRVKIGSSKPGTSQSFSLDRLEVSATGAVSFMGKSHDGLPIDFDVTPGHAQLVPVCGRGTEIFQPPKNHKDKEIADPTPIKIAELAIDYLDSVLEEADALC